MSYGGTCMVHGAACCGEALTHDCLKKTSPPDPEMISIIDLCLLSPVKVCKSENVTFSCQPLLYSALPIQT